MGCTRADDAAHGARDAPSAQGAGDRGRHLPARSAGAPGRPPHVLRRWGPSSVRAAGGQLRMVCQSGQEAG